MASSPHLSHSYSPQFLRLFNASTNNNNPNFSSSNSNSCSSSPYSSYPNNWHCRRGRSRNLAAFSGLKNTAMNQNLRAQAMSTSWGNLASMRGIVNMDDRPDHLLLLVHGILASPSDWTYFDAELKRRLGKKFLIYASSCNTFTKTFTGIDGAGKRLGDEVTQVVNKTEGLKKISFLAHSLGGLFARYAIAILYAPNDSYKSDELASSPSTKLQSSKSSNKGLIVGLEAINFITLATPHLGVRGNKQISIWCL